MSYATIYQCASDAAFLSRVTAACAQEGYPEPTTNAVDVRWPVASKSDIEAAYASALVAGNPDPGGDETVITDGMILSAIQTLPPPS